MECTPRIIRERKQVGKLPGNKPQTIVKIYCPILGEIVLRGDQAEKAVKNIREKTGNF